MGSGVRAGLIIGTWLLLRWLERRRPLRTSVDATPRTARNVAVAAITGIVIQVVERPVIDRLATWVERRRWGLVHAVTMPAWLRHAMAVGLLDYTLYLWHVLTHRVPALWRIHIVHHVDLDLDTSTAARFHATEFVLSVLWRAAQVLSIGVTRRALSTWQTTTLVSVLFHHSNVRLPDHLERWLVRFIVTPRMHGIHHSIVEAETNSNWSSGLTLWDRLHGTFRFDVPAEAVTIGVPAFRRPLPLGAVLALPFLPQPSWQLPGGGRPVRVRSNVGHPGAMGWRIGHVMSHLKMG